jgi:solute carrier family 6 GABA transporter-like protein 1
MGLPIIMIFILIVRGATLPNAIDGIRLYVGEFNGGQLVQGQIWQDALGTSLLEVVVVGETFRDFSSFSNFGILRHIANPSEFHRPGLL